MLVVEQMAQLARTLPSTATLPKDLAAALQSESSPVRANPGARIFDEGTPCSAFLAVTQGTVRVSKGAPDGRELRLYDIRPGEFCVLTVNCLLGKAAYPAKGTAVDAVGGVSVPARTFEHLLREAPEFREAAFKTLGIRLAETMSLVEELAFNKLDQRVAARLLRIASDGVCAVTHQQLAADLGCSREIVSRILESFKAQGLVGLARKRIDIVEPAGIARIAASGW